MAELLERWFATSAPNWAPTTVRNTRSIIDRHLTPGLGSVRVRDLTTAAIDDFYSRLRTKGRHDAEPLSTGTVRRVHAVLHRALAQAMRWDWIWANPAAAANKPAAEPTEMRPPAPAHIKALLAHAAADPAFHLFLSRHVPLPTISGRLAHARMSTTLNVYAHAVPSGDRPAATVIGDLVISAQAPQRPPPLPRRTNECMPVGTHRAVPGADTGRWPEHHSTRV